MIRMEVHPEISSGQVTLMGQTLVPDKDITQVTTNVMVRDGCTVIIGGLIQQELDTTGNQIPFLGNLKYIGPLFRNRTQNTIRNEVLILLTPRIVFGPAADRESRQASCQWQGRQAELAGKMSPLGRRPWPGTTCGWPRTPRRPASPTGPCASPNWPCSSIPRAWKPSICETSSARTQSFLEASRPSSFRPPSTRLPWTSRFSRRGSWTTSNASRPPRP